MTLKIVSFIFGFAGALGLLLFSMDMLSNGIQKGAGNSLQFVLKKISGTRFAAVLTGIFVTCIIQSSSATTVMTVSFVNAEILTLQQAIGIIFGANIGTTITAWIVSFFGFKFSLSAVAIPIFGIGFFFKQLKKFKIQNFGDMICGFGLLFMSLDLLGKLLHLSPSQINFLQNFSGNSFLGILTGVLAGTFFTALIHSSSAVTAIVITMAANGSLSWELSASLVLGSNIGTTIDSILSSLKASTNAKRTAFVHVAFNVTGTIIALLLFKPFLSLVDFIVPLSPEKDITTHIAMLHTVFNLLATLIFLPFVDQIALLSTKIIRDNPTEKEDRYIFPAILPGSHVSADLYSFQIQKEISKMSARVMEMFDSICNVFINGKNEVEKAELAVSKTENYIDEMNYAITGFLQHCSRLPNATRSDRMYFSKLLQITYNLENLSDECASIMYTLKKYLTGTSFSLEKKETKEIADYVELVRSFYEGVCLFISLGISVEQKKQSEMLEEKIDSTKAKLKTETGLRIEEGSDVKAELSYIDLVRKIEKAGDCIYSIVQSL